MNQKGGPGARLFSTNRAMTLKRIDHIQLAMPEGGEDKARQFYADTLGMREVQKPANLAKRGGCWFEAGDVRVHLGVDPDFRPAKKAHPAFLVEGLDTWRSHLELAGIQGNQDEPLDGFRRTYIADPFGNRIELMEIA